VISAEKGNEKGKEESEKMRKWNFSSLLSLLRPSMIQESATTYFLMDAIKILENYLENGSMKE
jgi:hypothetical protein